MIVRISVTPDPLVAGKKGVVCYDFDGVPEEVSSVELVITWDPQPPPTQILTLTRAQPCSTIDVPKVAQGVTIEDNSGWSGDYQGTVNPPP